MTGTALDTVKEHGTDRLQLAIQCAAPTVSPQQSMGEFHYNSSPVQRQQVGGQQLFPSQPMASVVNNTGLPDNLKNGIESLSGFSMDDVNVHYNSAKPAQLKAHAVAQGSDIDISSGQEHYLPHEAWHVVQQKQGRVAATTQLKGCQINDDSVLEKEADVMGQRALHHHMRTPGKLLRGGLFAAHVPCQLGAYHHLSARPRYSRSARKQILRGRRSRWKSGGSQQAVRKLSILERSRYLRAWHQKMQRDKDEGDMLYAITDEVMEALEELGKVMPKLTGQSQFDDMLKEIQSAFPVDILGYEALESGVMVSFNINPTYQVLLTGGKRIGMQMLGTGSSSCRTKVQWKAGELSFNSGVHPNFTARVGWQMRANPISQDHQKGMVAGKNNDQDTLMGNLAKKAGSKNTKYIKGHLLNDHLGGPAVADNLFPITDSANAKHLQWVEKYVKADIENGYVCQYSVVIDPEPGTITPVWQVVGGGRSGYTVDSTIKCEFSRLNMAGFPILASTHKIDIPSIYNNNLSGTYNPAGEAALTINNRYGVINEGTVNPVANTIGAYNEAVYKTGGYNQSVMHTANMSSATFGGAFSWLSGFGTHVNMRTLSQAQIKAVVKVSMTAANIFNWLAANPGPQLLALLNTVAGVGPATMKKMVDAKWEIL